MRIKLCWPDPTSRDPRCTEADLDTTLPLEKQQELVMSVIKKALKYSTEPLPDGVSEGDL